MIELTRNQIAALRDCSPATVSRQHLEKTKGGGYDILNTEVWDFITSPTVDREIENYKRKVMSDQGENENDSLDEIKIKAEIKYKNKQSRKLDLQHEIEKQNLVSAELIGIYLGYFASGIQNNFLTIGNRIARGDVRLRDRIDKAISKAIKKTISTAKKELEKEGEAIIKHLEDEG